MSGEYHWRDDRVTFWICLALRMSPTFQTGKALRISVFTFCSFFFPTLELATLHVLYNLVKWRDSIGERKWSKWKRFRFHVWIKDHYFNLYGQYYATSLKVHLWLNYALAFFVLFVLKSQVLSMFPQRFHLYVWIRCNSDKKTESPRHLCEYISDHTHTAYRKWSQYPKAWQSSVPFFE